MLHGNHRQHDNIIVSLLAFGNAKVQIKGLQFITISNKTVRGTH